MFALSGSAAVPSFVAWSLSDEVEVGFIHDRSCFFIVVTTWDDIVNIDILFHIFSYRCIVIVQVVMKCCIQLNGELAEPNRIELVDLELTFRILGVWQVKSLDQQTNVEKCLFNICWQAISKGTEAQQNRTHLQEWWTNKKAVIQLWVVKWGVEGAVINNSDWSCSRVFIYWVVRDEVDIAWQLWIINSFNESTCFMFTDDVPISSQELGCGSKMTNHRTGALFTLVVVCWQHHKSSCQGNFAL